MEAQYFEKETRSENPILKILMIAGIVLIAMLVIYTIFAIQNTAKQTQYVGATGTQDTINISETGTVYAKTEDIVAFTTFSTITQAATIEQALQKNDDKTKGVVDFIKRNGVAEEDIKTVDFNIYPQYEWLTKGVDLTIYPLGKRVIVAYQAVQSIEVKMKDNNMIGRIVQGSLENGASQVSGLKFIIDNEDALKKQAREQALDSAKVKATEIAQKMGVRLGKVIGFTESSYAPAYSPADKATAGTGSTFQIVVGESKVSVTVNVSYEIQ